MNLVGKALWYIESHFAEEISLDDVATACDVSRFHISRAFGFATGRSVMRYVRGRRLTEAARSLSRGAPDILEVALDAGYGSHEAFTRAFRDQFGVTPEAVRSRGNLDQLELVEPITMTETMTMNLEEPRRELGGQLLIAGLRARYSIETIAGIPMQWQRFGPYIGTISRRVDRMAYGVCCDFDETGHYDYLCGVAVSSVTDLPPELSSVRIPAQSYLVFRHNGHISGIPMTWRTIMEQWLPASGHRIADTPNFERYSDDFDANTGLGHVEIWIPIQTGQRQE
ncbi:MAG: AraC family transcriptional regulator [Acetobacteraceae bacterium]|jgi:AraC family transcriptional regulator